MSNNKIKHTPKLFINQPFTQFPDVIMQEKYYIKPKRHFDEQEEDHTPTATEVESSISSSDSSYLDTAEEKEIKETEVEIPITKENNLMQQESSEEAETPFSIKRRHDYVFRRVKNFKELTIDEKLDYLNNYPDQLPPVSCLYTTAETSYVGKLSMFLGEEIVIKLPNDTQVTLRKKELKEIRMLGFR